MVTGNRDLKLLSVRHDQFNILITLRRCPIKRYVYIWLSNDVLLFLLLLDRDSIGVDLLTGRVKFADNLEDIFFRL